MRVLKIHQREFPASLDRVGALIDTLGSRDDALWPVHSWPLMLFDGSLRIGAAGGHGRIGYRVEAYAPRRLIKLRFTEPWGFRGSHSYEVVSGKGNSALLRHTLEMRTWGPAILSWPLVYRPLHDALIEDSLATAEASLGLTPRMRAWSPWVKFLRFLVSRGDAHSQVTPPIRRAAAESASRRERDKSVALV